MFVSHIHKDRGDNKKKCTSNDIVAVIFVISTLNLVKMPLFVHVIDKTQKTAALCNFYCACLLPLCFSKSNIEKYDLPEKEEVTGRRRAM
jgi:hypothetical protein